MRFRPDTTLRRLVVQPNGPVLQILLKDMLYRIPCIDCDHAYVGQSGYSLSCRVKEHQRAFWNEDINVSDLAEHVWKEHYNTDWQNAKLLEGNERHWHLNIY